MGTQDMSPLPSGLLSLLKQADALVVEADISGHESPFAGLESDLTGRPSGRGSARRTDARGG